MNEWLRETNKLLEPGDMPLDGEPAVKAKIAALFHGPAEEEQGLCAILQYADHHPNLYPGQPFPLNALIRCGQSVFINERNTSGLWLKGKWYNGGVGLLQMYYGQRWGRSFDDLSSITPITTPNPHVTVIARRPDNPDYRVPGFNSGIRADLRAFLLDHHRAKRVDIFVNGVLTVNPSLHKATQALQRRLDEAEGIAQDAPFAWHSPVWIGDIKAPFAQPQLSDSDHSTPLEGSRCARKA